MNVWSLNWVSWSVLLIFFPSLSLSLSLRFSCENRRGKTQKVQPQKEKKIGREKLKEKPTKLRVAALKVETVKTPLGCWLSHSLSLSLSPPPPFHPPPIISPTKQNKGLENFPVKVYKRFTITKKCLKKIYNREKETQNEGVGGWLETENLTWKNNK